MEKEVKKNSSRPKKGPMYDYYREMVKEGCVIKGLPIYYTDGLAVDSRGFLVSEEEAWGEDENSLLKLSFLLK